MQDYRDVIQEHFNNNQLIKGLWMYDGLLIGLGLLFLLFGEFSIISLSSDIFAALGFWCFWLGIAVTYIKKNEVGLSVGLGGYALLNLVAFLVACVHSAGRYYGFYGFFPLFNLIAVGYLLTISGGIKYYQEFFAGNNVQAVHPGTMQQGASESTVACPNCGAKIDQSAPFCSNCGNKTPEARLCRQCGSPLEENALFCVTCGAKVPADQNKTEPEANGIKEESAT